MVQKWRNVCAVLSLGCVALMSPHTHAKPDINFKDPELTFIFPKKADVLDPAIEGARRSAALSELLKRVGFKTITYKDPIFGKPKTYKAFELKNLLKLAFDKDWQRSEFSDVEFVSYKGDVSMAPIHTLKDDGCYVAFEDVDQPTWEKFPSTDGLAGGEIPGPFYMFWVGVDQKASDEYLWFWQIKSLRLVRFDERFPKVLPVTQDKDSPEYRGFKVFQGNCIRCHSIDRQGGKVGPDLNSPQSVVSYRNTDFLKKFIKQASAFRYTNMPDFDHLSQKELSDLISYFKNKDKYRK